MSCTLQLSSSQYASNSQSYQKRKYRTNPAASSIPDRPFQSAEDNDKWEKELLAETNIDLLWDSPQEQADGSLIFDNNDFINSQQKVEEEHRIYKAQSTAESGLGIPEHQQHSFAESSSSSSSSPAPLIPSHLPGKPEQESI